MSCIEMFRKVEDLFLSEGPSNGLNSRGKDVRNCIEPVIDDWSSFICCHVSVCFLQITCRNLTESWLPRPQGCFQVNGVCLYLPTVKNSHQMPSKYVISYVRPLETPHYELAEQEARENKIPNGIASHADVLRVSEWDLKPHSFVSP